ncbi:hypothetical protein F5X71_09470 [Nocardia brasiliensis]|uniref:Uncharacterized protein n=1 Tax=Nocardia brasiliensis TaxID=37326 RepID=A0A6G9XNM0_NOCBR|nr:hypothetical protein [Nocardia brasiliensis]QIS02517.1 hypothetical protein F5X71_09470 [Nocardia brasiliensis]
MANILTEAREGRLAIKLKAEDFVYIDRDCDYFKDVIRNIQKKAEGADDGNSGSTSISAIPAGVSSDRIGHVERKMDMTDLPGGGERVNRTLRHTWSCLPIV